MASFKAKEFNHILFVLLVVLLPVIGLIEIGYWTSLINSSTKYFKGEFLVTKIEFVERRTGGRRKRTERYWKATGTIDRRVEVMDFRKAGDREKPPIQVGGELPVYYNPTASDFELNTRSLILVHASDFLARKEKWMYAFLIFYCPGIGFGIFRLFQKHRGSRKRKSAFPASSTTAMNL